jgi:hypothetical protein
MLKGGSGGEKTFLSWSRAILDESGTASPQRANDPEGVLSPLNGSAIAYTQSTMSIRVTNTEKKAEIARDLVVAYLANVEKDQLNDLEKVESAIKRLVDVVDRTFEVPDRPQAGFGMSPSIPQRGA